jgi:thiosulfate dehydrogenase
MQASALRLRQPAAAAARQLLRALLLLCAALVLAGCARQAGPTAAAEAQAAAQAELRARFPPDKHGELVYQGYLMFTQTPKAARVFAGNGLSCSNCHLDAGRKPDAAPLWAAYGMYPAYLAKADRVVTFAERVQQCFSFSMNGLPPPLDSHEMAALLAYAQWVARGQPVGVQLPGRGFPTIARTGADPNPLNGKALYAQRCAACHGAHGEGRKGADGYAVPPLWGLQSYNKGAGLNRIDLMAGFLKANMPLGNADLRDQEALDIAAWVQLQERWPDPRKGLVAGLLER